MEAGEALGMDDEQASTRRLVAPAWLPHPFKSSGAGLATRIHAMRQWSRVAA
jgi:hypothetical protein